MFYLLNVIKMQWLIILSISGLYSHTQKIFIIMKTMRRLPIFWSEVWLVHVTRK